MVAHTIKAIDGTALPAEVRDALHLYLDDDKQAAWVVAVYLKTSIDKGSAWVRTEAHTHNDPQNRWRKNHTENYWVWFMPDTNPKRSA